MSFKLIYYGFGAFIGLVCGSLINMIFFWVEKSGTYSAAELVRDYGVFGRFLLEVINVLPFFGVALGIILVKILFGEELDER
jgi:hypothetical protein